MNMAFAIDAAAAV
jgi:subtilisin-like proprotein convertase family protein